MVLPRYDFLVMIITSWPTTRFHTTADAALRWDRSCKHRLLFVVIDIHVDHIHQWRLPRVYEDNRYLYTRVSMMNLVCETWSTSNVRTSYEYFIRADSEVGHKFCSSPNGNFKLFSFVWSLPRIPLEANEAAQPSTSTRPSGRWDTGILKPEPRVQTDCQHTMIFHWHILLVFYIEQHSRRQILPRTKL